MAALVVEDCGYVAGSCARVGYLPCMLVEAASLCPYWNKFMLSFLILKIKKFFFPFRENSSGKIFLKCLVARNKGEEVDNNSSYLLC